MPKKILAKQLQSS